MKKINLEICRCTAMGGMKKCKRCQFSKWFLVKDMKRKSCPIVGAEFFVEVKGLLVGGGKA